MNRFTDKIVVITGGTRGIGLAAARRFIKQGTQRELGAMSEARVSGGAARDYFARTVR
jgi:NAD(P)-dependent dehydrogenase (short-subunit alcohol dehydrogenase family)